MKVLKGSVDGNKRIASLSSALNERDAEISPSGAVMAQMLIGEHKCFKGFALFLRNTSMQQVNAREILETLHGTNVKKDLLLKRYNAFYSEYWRKVEKGVADVGGSMAEITAATMALATKKGISYSSKVQSYLVNVFAIWTLSQVESEVR